MLSPIATGVSCQLNDVSDTTNINYNGEIIAHNSAVQSTVRRMIFNGPPELVKFCNLYNNETNRQWLNCRRVGRVQPPVHFSTPQLLKNYLGGVRLNPPKQRSVTQCILLSACIQRFPTGLSFRIIRSSEAKTVLLIYFNRCHTCGCSIFVQLCHIHCYVYMRL